MLTGFVLLCLEVSGLIFWPASRFLLFQPLLQWWLEVIMEPAEGFAAAVLLSKGSFKS